MNNNQVFNAACRSDFYTFMQKAFTVIDGSQEFQGNWHLELICDKLEQCMRGEIKRLIINIPPRNLKSHCASICLPAYILGHKPNAKIVCVSYAQVLSNKLSRKTRKLMESSFYKNIFQTKLDGKNTENEFETTKNGSRYATSVDGALTGDGGDFIIIDDPIKADEANSPIKRDSVNQWYNNTVISRLNNKNTGVIIVVMQRLHLDDLTGHLLKQDGWELLSLPAIAEQDEVFQLSDGRFVGRKIGTALNPLLESIEILENHRKIMTEYNFSAQYQQRPIPEKGNIINYDYFILQPYDRFPPFSHIFQSWDIALSTGDNNDYSVCITAGIHRENGWVYILDITRDKWEFPDLTEKIVQMKNKFNADHVIIEDSPISKGLIQQLKQYNFSIITHKPEFSKEVRANNQSFRIKAGEVILPQDAPWLEAFKSEVLAFPKGIHDDQVDALIQLLENVQEFNPTRFKDKPFPQTKGAVERLLKKHFFKPIKND